MKPALARVLMSAPARLKHVWAVPSSFEHIVHSCPVGAFTDYTARAPQCSVVFPPSLAVPCLCCSLPVTPDEEHRTKNIVWTVWTSVIITRLYGILRHMEVIRTWFWWTILLKQLVLGTP